MIVLYGLAVVTGILIHLVDAVFTFQSELLTPDNPLSQMASLSLFAVGLWLPGVLGILLLQLPVRRFVARFIPIDPDNPVHVLALTLSSLVLVNLLVTLGIGLGNLAEQLASQDNSNASGVVLISLWAQQIFTALLACLGVGWMTRRSGSETLQRLGLVVPSLRQVGLGIGLGLLLIPSVIIIEAISNLFGLSANTDVADLSEQLLGPLFQSPFGIFTVGAAAAIGEETLLRGALQPRFGLLLTTVLFALLHSNYGISLSTLIVLVLGYVLGVVRMRTNTTTAMIVHAVYNSTLGLLANLIT
jgi:membrane protease YdiL (CAAX protease family)